ncbi:MAG: Ni/Fe-hydrogenase cytochrome b subunit [Desulfuromonas thiophila]|nr:Ni/Fe-hydrogenase cytochrome b subunit [Desulfuromonas thiophila]
MNTPHPQPAPLRRPFWTPGVLVLLCLVGAAAISLLLRFSGGIGAVSNLSTGRPWGLWVAVDVASGVALAAGGFTTAALCHLFGRHRYAAIERPALLTAMLGYTFVVLGLLVDIGRSWAIWKPVIFQNHHSVLFEVAMCVLVYLHVLYIEFLPIVLERLRQGVRLPGRLQRLSAPLMTTAERLHRPLQRHLWLFLIAGVVLSCMHQSSLGALLLIAPTKLHPLWYSPLLPLLFLTSAIAVGYPMVVVEANLARASLASADEQAVLTPLAGISRYLLGLYLLLKIADLSWRGAWPYLLEGSAQSLAFIIELGLGVLLPWLLLLSARLRRSRRGLFCAAALIVGGVLLNRYNVFVTGFMPPFSGADYSPALGEWLITAGLIASLMLLYRLLVTHLPILVPAAPTPAVPENRPQEDRP